MLRSSTRKTSRSKTYSYTFIEIVLILFCFSCNTVKPFYNKSETNWQTRILPETKPIHTVYLIGDAGDLHQEDPIKIALTNQIKQHDEGESSLVFLGDNIYHHGLPEPDALDREAKENIMMNQMEVADDYLGNTIFVPGNHDWNDAHDGGWEAILREEAYVEAHFGNENVFLPDNGCPGPVEVQLNDDLTLLVIDSEWWTFKYDKPGTECASKDKDQFVEHLEAMIEKNQQKNLLVVAHHPVISKGVHGGKFGFFDHLFPLRNVRSWLYLPLPIIGSIYPVSRMMGVSRQDIPNKYFKTYKGMLETALSEHDKSIYAAGHEHNMQLFRTPELIQVISGAGSKINFAKRSNKANFIYQERGYCRLSYYENGEVWIEYFIANAETNKESVVYIEKLF